MKHWTEWSLDNYLHKIISDAAVQFGPLGHGPTEDEILDKLSEEDVTLADLAKITRREGLKIALVIYDDNDPANEKGPIMSDIFRICWERHGSPRDFFELNGE